MAAPTNNAALEMFLAEAEIRSLLVRERYYRDTAQWDKLRQSWHPDNSKTEIFISWYRGQVDGFVAGSKKMTEQGAQADHVICPVEIHFNGDKAVSESTGSIAVRFDHDGQLFDLTSYTRFQSRLERVDGVWKLVSLRCLYLRDTIVPAFPYKDAHLPVPDFPRQPYAGLAWSLGRKGIPISDDMPGADRPETVANFVEADMGWLNA